MNAIREKSLRKRSYTRVESDGSLSSSEETFTSTKTLRLQLYTHTDIVWRTLELWHSNVISINTVDATANLRNRQSFVATSSYCFTKLCTALNRYLLVPNAAERSTVYPLREYSSSANNVGSCLYTVRCNAASRNVEYTVYYTLYCLL